ncbi:MAG: hypothetical protein P8188_00855 [Gemmatimonadota bacterium]|jgi:hypothetical protein
MRLLTALAAASLLLAGCASRNPPETGPPVVVEIRNNNFQDATVYAFREGERQRLGVVIGKTDDAYALPWRPNLTLRLEVRFLGGGACATRPILMEPGQRFVLELQPDLRLNQDCEPIR